MDKRIRTLTHELQKRIQHLEVCEVDERASRERHLLMRFARQQAEREVMQATRLLTAELACEFDEIER